MEFFAFILAMAVCYLLGFIHGRNLEMTSEEKRMIEQFRQSGVVCGRHPLTGNQTSVVPD